MIDCGYNEHLASYICETEGKTVQECTDEIMHIVSKDSIENDIEL